MIDDAKLLSTAVEHHRHGSHAPARTGYAAVIARRPGEMAGYFNYGTLLHETGDTQAASRLFGRAIRLDPGLLFRLRNMGLSEYGQDILGQIVAAGDNIDHFSAPGPTQTGHAPMLWPPKFRFDTVAAIRGFLQDILPVPEARPQPIIDRGQSVVTFGSCFAMHVGQMLKRFGIDVLNSQMPEDANSTFANRYLFDWLVHGNHSPFTEYFQRTHGEDTRLLLREALADSRTAIMTIGVAPCFFHAETGAFAFPAQRRSGNPAHYRLRMTGVAENVENVLQTVALLRTLNPQIALVLTVSPVPLSGFVRNEPGISSIVEADCLSKSVMRVVAHEVVQRDPAIIYWPSFEIVRWLGGHAAFPAFGADDGLSRHVNEALVELIMTLFLEHHGAPGLTNPPSPPPSPGQPSPS